MRRIFPPRRRGRTPLSSLGLAVALAAVTVLLWLDAAAPFPRAAERMPEFPDRSPQAWLNTAPLSRADLAGKVVLIEIWTSG